MTHDEPIEVIVTAPDRDWLEDLCHQLVDARLAASAHVVHPVTSIYRWKGTVETPTEARAFLRSAARCSTGSSHTSSSAIRPRSERHNTADCRRKP